MKAKHLLLIAAAAVVLLLLRLLLVGPEERIRREMTALAEEASKTGPESPLMAVAAAKSIAGHFSAEGEALDVRTGQAAKGRDAIARAVGWARESWDEGELFFEQLEIELQGEGAAEARGRVRILGPGGEPVSPHDGTRLRLEWAKIGGNWEIVRAEAELPPQ